jgi:pimeloyl-ACP methyl ester carboxylesterase
MNISTPPEYVARPNGVRLAIRRVGGSRAKSAPTIVFLPGYLSDMQGGKALAIEAWAIRNGHAMLRFDYSGCGESEGTLDDATLAVWRDDALLIIERLVSGPVVLVGSSMGGWLMLLIALALPSDVKALIGIAAAPDFTDWGYTADEKMTLLRDGRLEQPSDYGPEPTVTTRAFWQSGEANRLLNLNIAIDCPVRLLHGQRDADVPWHHSLHLAEKLHSSDVQVTLIKDGDHRLSRDQDIALILATLDEVMQNL